ncbi:hypothetical protein Tco_1354198 [Tanacetum coccineum]
MNDIPSSYANKLSPMSFTKANLWKIESNVPNDVDYDVWLPLALVHEVNDGMKNLFYGYVIEKRLAFLVVECTCFIFGHLLDDCPKAPKRVVNKMDKGKGQTFGADDEGFCEVKKKKSCGNNGGNKNFKLVLVKQKILYLPKAKQSAEGISKSPKMTPFVGMNKASTSSYNKESTSTRGNGFSLCNSFEDLIFKIRLIAKFCKTEEVLQSS